MTRRLLLSYLSITAFVLLVLEVPLGVTLARSDRDQISSEVERDARVLATFVEDTLEGVASADLQSYAEQYEERTGGRVVVVDADGTSVADSSAAPGDAPRDFSQNRPEIERALAGELATGTRHSRTLGENLLYVAVPVASSGRVYGAVRVTYPIGRIDDRIRRNWWSLVALAGVVLATVALVGSLLARSVTRPVRALAGAAERLAGGDLAARAPREHGPPEVRALAGEFNAMAERLEELVGAQRAFVADASHELRTPLTALRLRLENLESVAPHSLRAELGATSGEVERLTRLVEGLLSLARAEGRRPERARIDVVAAARERVETWEALAEEQGVGIVLVADVPRAEAFAVPDAVGQVLDNLLANALEVAPRGSTVTVRVDNGGEHVELHVLDEGPGLDDDQRSRAFGRFWRAPDAPAGRGSGLGLAIVAQLAAASGGAATLDRAPSGGLDAVVRFPTRDVAAFRGSAAS
jgi:signal transduction histidine kinase